MATTGATFHGTGRREQKKCRRPACFAITPIDSKLRFDCGLVEPVIRHCMRVTDLCVWLSRGADPSELAARHAVADLVEAQQASV